MEELTFLSSIGNGVLRCFNAEACPKLRSMRLDLQPGANIECGISSEILSFSTSVPSLPFKRSGSKVTVYLLFDTASSQLLIFKSGVEVQSRILQVAVDSNEYTAEIYMYDNQLLATLTMGEGRQRFDADKYDSTSADSGAIKIVESRNMWLEQEIESMRRQMEQEKWEKEDMRRQVEKMQDEMKHQTRS